MPGYGFGGLTGESPRVPAELPARYPPEGLLPVVDVVRPSVIEAAKARGLPMAQAYDAADNATLNDLRITLMSALRQRWLTTADTAGLALLGEEVLAPSTPAENEETYRERLLETPARYRAKQGTVPGFMWFLKHLGWVRPAWVYLPVAGTACVAAIHDLHNLTIYGAASDALFTVGVMDSDMALRGHYIWSSGSWVATTADAPVEEGVSASVLNALTEDDWRLLLPCRGLFLMMSTGTTLPVPDSVFAILDATYE